MQTHERALAYILGAKMKYNFFETEAVIKKNLCSFMRKKASLMMI